MPRRSLLTPAERNGLLALPSTDDELIRYYTLSEADLLFIRQRRGNHNRLGFAVQLCFLRYPGIALPTDAEPPAPLLAIVGLQLSIEPDIWPQYARRPETRREHLAELQAWLNLAPFTITDYRRFVHRLADLAQQTDRGIVLAQNLVEMLRQQRIIIPPVDVIERICSEALTRGTRQVYEDLTVQLDDHHQNALDGLLAIREGTKSSGLIWLRQPPGPPKPKHVLNLPGAVENYWLTVFAGRIGTCNPPESPLKNRSRRWPNDRPALARPRTDPSLRDPGGCTTGHTRHADRRDHRHARPIHGHAVQQGQTRPR